MKEIQLILFKALIFISVKHGFTVFIFSTYSTFWKKIQYLTLFILSVAIELIIFSYIQIRTTFLMFQNLKFILVVS